MTSHSNRAKLLLGCLAIAAIWLVLLPRISQWRPIRSMIHSHQAVGIDPSAMFYSDLEHLDYREGMLRRKP